MLAAAALALAGCGGARAGAPPAVGAAPLVVTEADDERLAAGRIADRSRAAGVVYLGEQHDNPAHHAHQLAVVDALVARGVRLALGFEMLDESQQAAVDEALSGAVGARDLDERLRWSARGWPAIGMYQPLFEAAARDKLPVIALDLDPAVSRRIAREGLASVGPRAQALVSLLPADAAREAAITAVIREGHCGLLPEARLPTMVDAWHARNVTMARRIATALDRGLVVVVIVGRGHQAAGGLPAQLAALRPGSRQFIVDMIEAPPGTGPEGPVRATTADAIWLTPAVERGDPCAGLRREPR